MKIEELEKYRDEDGYIDMDEVLATKEFETLKETRGSQNREKFWITFDDAKIMLRTSNLDSENVEYTNYAELIVEELAKQVDLPCAHYDLIKYKGQKGVYTKSVLERENESLILAKTLLDQTETEDPYDVTVSIDDLFKSYNNFRKYDDIPKEQIANMWQDTAKIAIFETFTMATDSHPENIGYVYYSDSDEKSIKCSPLFDNEHSLMLEQPMEIIDEMLADEELFNEKVKYQYQAIVIPEVEREFNVIDELKIFKTENSEKPLDWEEMLFYLCDYSKSCEEYVGKCSRNLNIENAMKKVEERIHAKLPDKLKKFASACFDTRKKMIDDLCIGIDEVGIW